MPYFLLFIGVASGILLWTESLLLIIVLIAILGVMFYLPTQRTFVYRAWTIPFIVGLAFGAAAMWNAEKSTVFSGESCEGYVHKGYRRSVSVAVDTCGESREVKGILYVSCQNKCPEQYERVKFLVKDRERFGRFIGRGSFTEFVKSDQSGWRKVYYYILNQGKVSRISYYSWLQDRLPSDNASLIASMLFGDTELSQETVDLMKDVGVVHVVAISGINIAYLLLLARYLGRFLSKTVGEVLEMMTLSLLYFIVGEAVSLIRALIMSFWVIFAKRGGFYAINWSFLVSPSFILLIDPRYLWDAGFQLVSSACFGVYICAPIAGRWVKNKFLLNIFESIIIWACVVPVQFIIFHKTPVSGLIVGLLISPFIEGITVLGYCSVVLRYFPGVAEMSRVFLGILSSTVLLVIHLFHV